jgi:hypothetical protein
MSGKLAAPLSYRRIAIGVALVLALAEIGLFAMAWRFGILADPGPSPRAAKAFVVFGTLLTLQAMWVVGIAWAIVAISRTELEWDGHLRLEHPWRSWSGDWTELRRVWWQKGWLALEVDGAWRRWYVRVPDDSAADLTAFRSALPSGVWLEGATLRAYLLRRVLPMILAAAVICWMLLLAVPAILRSL